MKKAKEIKNIDLTNRIKELHLEGRGIFGAPRIYEKLVSERYQWSKNRIARLMKKAKIMRVTRRKKMVKPRLKMTSKQPLKTLLIVSLQQINPISFSWPILLIFQQEQSLCI